MRSGGPARARHLGVGRPRRPRSRVATIQFGGDRLGSPRTGRPRMRQARSRASRLRKTAVPRPTILARREPLRDRWLASPRRAHRAPRRSPAGAHSVGPIFSDDHPWMRLTRSMSFVLRSIRVADVCRSSCTRSPSVAFCSAAGCARGRRSDGSGRAPGSPVHRDAAGGGEEHLSSFHAVADKQTASGGRNPMEFGLVQPSSASQAERRCTRSA